MLTSVSPSSASTCCAAPSSDARGRFLRRRGDADASGVGVALVSGRHVVLPVPACPRDHRDRDRGARLAAPSFHGAFRHGTGHRGGCRRSRPLGDVYGTKLHANVWRPANKDARGRVLVYVHGGGFTGGALDQRPTLLQWYANQGYTVFDVEYRMHPQPLWPRGNP
ncbi:hypothetical protein GCM10022222_45740 [Amycolatopsis ultiminotia]|uniref:BD-FAE-like domain-containing protein n=1 Tax=Amycolatopsis ultiminotia TaxID=543629 RepID=A0ABP6WUI8_9PSEU